MDESLLGYLIASGRMSPQEAAALKKDFINFGLNPQGITAQSQTDVLPPLNQPKGSLPTAVDKSSGLGLASRIANGFTGLGMDVLNKIAETKQDSPDLAHGFGKLAGETTSSQTQRQADILGETANSLFKQDDDETFLGNLTDVPGAAVASLGSAALEYGIAPLQSLFETPERQKESEEIVLDATRRQAEELAALGEEEEDAPSDSSSSTEPKPGEQLDLAEGLGFSVADFTETNFVGGDGLDDVRSQGGKLGSRLDGLSAGLAKPVELNERDFALAEFLSTINGGGFTPGGYDIAQSDLQSSRAKAAASVGSAGLAASATGRGGIGKEDKARLKAARTLAGKTETALRTKRNSYVDGNAGDYHYGVNSGNSGLQNKAVFSQLGQIDEGSYTAVSGKAVATLAGISVDEIADSRDISELAQNLAGNASVERLFRQANIKVNFDDPLKFRNQLAELLSVKGILTNDYTDSILEKYPEIGQSFGIGTPSAYRNFVKDSVRADVDSLVGFKKGGSRNKSTAGTERLNPTSSRVDLTNMDTNAVKKFNEIADHMGGNLNVNSAHRSKAYNDALRAKGHKGVAKNSQHIQGTAIDVRVDQWTDAEKRKFVKKVRDMGGSIGFYGNGGHVHVDFRRFGGQAQWGKKPDWMKGYTK